MWMSSMPPRIPAANLDLKGFHTRYSVLVEAGVSASPFVAPVRGVSMAMRFSPYNDSPGARFFVQSMSSLPRATKTPACL